MLASLVALILSLQAAEMRRLAAPDARQGVASGLLGLYAIDNRAIARIDPADGRVLTRWVGNEAHFKHLNSCIVRHRDLICAASNYPEIPHASRIETFDARTLVHKGTRELGAGLGSLTWLDRRNGSWWATFANYDGKGGAPGRDHRATMLVRYDRHFRERGRWLFPPSVLERFAPRSSSGGAWGPGGLLYVTGHDRPELYALRVPKSGDVLEHVATIAIPTGGQAIGWDARQPGLLWSIERSTREIVASQIPEVKP